MPIPIRSADASAACLGWVHSSAIRLTCPSSSLSLSPSTSLSNRRLLVMSTSLPSKVTTAGTVTTGVWLAKRQRRWKRASSSSSSLSGNCGGCSGRWLDDRFRHPVGLSFTAKMKFCPQSFTASSSKPSVHKTPSPFHASTRGHCAESRKFGGKFWKLAIGGVSTVARAWGRVDGDGDGDGDAMPIPSSDVPELTIGSAVVLTETPDYVKTAEPMPMLKVNRGILKAGDAGRVIDRRPKDVWAIRFSVGAFLIDRKYFKTFE